MDAVSSTGVVLALTAAAAGSVATLAFAAAGRAIGSLNVVLVRIAIAVPVLWMAVALRDGTPVTGSAVAWMSVSGVAGMAIGDVLLFEAYVLLGPRLSVLLNLGLAPVFAVALAAAFLGERLGIYAGVGSAMVVASSLLAVITTQPSTGAEPAAVTARGVAIAVASALCTAIGLITAVRASGLEPVMGSAIRVTAAAVALWVVPLATGTALRVLRSAAAPAVLIQITSGTLLSTVGGTVCYVAAMDMAPATVVSALGATGPLWILPAVMIRYRTRPTPAAWMAAIGAVVGVVLITLRRGQ